ncbi:MAG TPA: hypothetical protein QGF05_12865 [Dehalococcoidia bacterium]|nr:hypothetical protein [Dehalococcoidia bacterium]
MYWISEEMVQVMVRERVPAPGAPRFVAPPRRRTESHIARHLHTAGQWFAQAIRGTKSAQPRLSAG